MYRTNFILNLINENHKFNIKIEEIQKNMSFSNRYNSTTSNQNYEDNQNILSHRSQQTHETTMLKHQIKQLLIQLEIKDQQLFFIKNQLKSTSQENLKKISILQTSLHQTKKQLAEVRHQGLKGKRLQNQKSQIQLKELKQSFQSRLKQEVLQYEQLITQNQMKHKKQLDQISSKYQKIIILNKQERETLQNILNDRKHSSKSHQKALIQKNNQLTDEKIQVSRQLQIIKEKYQNLKCQIHSKELQARNREADHKRQIIIQRSKYDQYINLVQKLKNQIQEIMVNNTQEKDNLMVEVQKLKFQLDRHKKLLELKDSQALSQVSDGRLNSARSASMNPQIHITQQKHCNHEGLLKQLQKCIQLKDAEIEQLKETIKKWENSIGFNKKLGTRVRQVGQISSQTFKAYNKQKQTIQNHYKKI